LPAVATIATSGSILPQDGYKIFEVATFSSHLGIVASFHESTFAFLRFNYYWSGLS